MLTFASQVVFESVFVSSRLQNYRTYKFDWTGYPTDDPAVKAAVHAAKDGSLNTVAHVSWNGATEVKSWKFYALQDDFEEVLLGTVPRKGFETAAVFPGYHKHVLAEAMDSVGRSLGNSSFVLTELPLGWEKPHGVQLLQHVPQLRRLQSDSSTLLALAFLSGILVMALYNRLSFGRGGAGHFAILHHMRKLALD